MLDEHIRRHLCYFTAKSRTTSMLLSFDAYAFFTVHCTSRLILSNIHTHTHIEQAKPNQPSKQRQQFKPKTKIFLHHTFDSMRWNLNFNLNEIHCQNEISHTHKIQAMKLKTKSDSKISSELFSKKFMRNVN